MAVSISTAPTPSSAPTPAPPSSQQPFLTLPPPHIFDILPPLHEILARIDHGNTATTNTTTTNNNNNPTLHPDGTTTTNTIVSTAPTGDESLISRYAESPALDPKDLPNEVLALKTRIRKAVKELERLPDIYRSCEEQADEIRELEARRSAQEELMRRLAEVAREMQGRG